MGVGNVRSQGRGLLSPALTPFSSPSAAGLSKGQSMSLTLPGSPWPSPLTPALGVCGFLTFGAAVDPDVLLSYPSEDVAVAVARAFIILSVLTSYPILHFCGR